MEMIKLFVDVCKWMQRMDPNGKWDAFIYSRDSLEAIVAATLYWHQENPRDSLIQSYFGKACQLYGSYDNQVALAINDIRQAAAMAEDAQNKDFI